LDFNIEKTVLQDHKVISDFVGEGNVKNVLKSKKSYVIKNKTGSILCVFSYDFNGMYNNVVLDYIVFSSKCRKTTKGKTLQHFINFMNDIYGDCTIEYYINERNLEFQLELKDIGFIAKEFSDGGYVQNGKYRLSYVGNC